MPQMTISQALRRVKKLKGQIADDSNRAALSNVYMKRDAPSYDTAELLVSVARDRAELVRTSAAIAQANATNTIKSGEGETTLAEAIRVLQEIKGEISWFKSLKVTKQHSAVQRIQVNPDAGYGKEPVFAQEEICCVVTEGEAHAMVRKLQDQFDKTNDLIETANHQVTISAVSAAE